MYFLAPLLATDPATPALTWYFEQQRLEFSGKTLQNWVAKTTAFFEAEYSFEAPTVLIASPQVWYGAMLALGAVAAGLPVVFPHDPLPDADVVVAGLAADLNPNQQHLDLLQYTSHPFGLGVIEQGQPLVAGAIDVAPLVRVQPDDYHSAGSIASFAAGGVRRVAVSSWHTAAEFEQRLLAPLGAGGSVVVCAEQTPPAEVLAVEHAELL